MQRYKLFSEKHYIDVLLLPFFSNFVALQKESSVELLPDESSLLPDQGMSVSDALNSKLQCMV